MKNAPVHDQSTLHPPVTDTAPRVDPLLDTAPCGFVSFTDDGRVRSVNATFLEMLGLSQAELLGQHIETVLSNGARISYQTLFFPLLRLEGRADEIFLLLRAKDGSDVGAIGNYLACNLDTKSELVVLIRRGDHILGQIDVDSDMTAGFGSREHADVKLVADALAVLL